MRRLFLVLLIAAIALPLHAADKKKHKMVAKYNTLTKTWSSFPAVTLYDVQFCNLDSLKKLDTLQLSNNNLWTYQTSGYMDDTVVVTAQVIAPSANWPAYNGLTFTARGWTMVLHDTAANSNAWGGVLVRVGADADTASLIVHGFTAPERGDIIEITCRVEEFPVAPAERVNSTTQLRPIPGIFINIVGSKAIPAPTRVPVTTFYEGAYPGGKVKYSTGEQYEGSLVELNNLTVNVTVNPARGTWAMVDASGNYIADYDASHFFTIGNGTQNIPGDPSFVPPPVGAVIDTIRGIMLTVAGGENLRGYRICPLYPGDVVYGVSKPNLTTHRRYPVVVRSTDSTIVQAYVRQVSGGYPIGLVNLMVSLNGGPWQARAMSLISGAPDSGTYQTDIVDIDKNPHPLNTFVRYFIKAFDNQGNSSIYANSSASVGQDTSKGFFFYTVRDNQLTIHDIQYTPYANGRSGYLGGTVSISGIVTADTADMNRTPVTGGTNTWYIQSGSTPWNGIWVVSRDSATGANLSAMRRGDSVTVTGNVQEQAFTGGEVTRILDSLVTIHASGRPVPAPVTVATSTFGPGALGSPIAEQYEGMLVRFVNATLSDIYPTFVDITEYSIDDGTSPVIIRRDGRNTYSNLRADTLQNKLILHQGDRFDSLVGIVHFGSSRYKVVPRLNNDFAVGEPYTYSSGWNLLSVGRAQIPVANFAKTILFPPAVSNAFAYTPAGYAVTPTLDNQRGFWIKFGSAQTIRQLGRKVTGDTIPVLAGWNLVGALGNAMPVSSVTALPGGNTLSVFYGYSGSYTIADTLKPSRGYWVKADLNGSLIRTAPSIMVPKMAPVAVSTGEFNTLTISDSKGNSQTLYFTQDAEGTMRMRDYEMPPAAPEAGAFSARYASGRILEAYPASIRNGMQFGINIDASFGPVTVRWDIKNPEGKHFMLADAQKGKLLKSQALVGSGSVLVKASGNVQLELSVEGGAALPKEFSLSQNYPNPFNPSTKFVVALPEAARLDIAIYNVLGQKVATVANEDRDAGYHTITWNGTAGDGAYVASGVYFVRMQAGSFSGIRKIMMMK